MAPSKQPLLLGAHISVAGGFEKAIERGESIGCTAIQIFTKSNRQWKAKPITDAEATTFKKACKRSNIIQSVGAHASYLINLGSPKADIAEKSVFALRDEILRCEQLGIPYLVVHPGSCLGTDEQECLERIAHNLDSAFQSTTGTTQVLLETMAGQGNVTCHQFEQIATIYKHTKNKKLLGVCLDTCHIFAAGYRFDTPEQYASLWKQFDTIIGRKLLKMIHLNDSQKELGSRVDRHEDIGKGKIGLQAFELLMNDPTLFDVPKILETPKECLEDDLRNMQQLTDLLSKETRDALNIMGGGI